MGNILRETISRPSRIIALEAIIAAKSESKVKIEGNGETPKNIRKYKLTSSLSIMRPLVPGDNPKRLSSCWRKLQETCS